MRQTYESTGVQPGDVVADLTVHIISGGTQQLSELWQDNPALIMTASLTCPVARDHIGQLDDLREQFADAVNVVVLYTIEAHPKGDPAPDHDVEWLTRTNQREGILHRQPTTMDERMTLAKKFQRLTETTTPILIDGMDNTGLQQFGHAPNLALLIRKDGTVAVRQGWFDGPAMAGSIEALPGE